MVVPFGDFVDASSLRRDLNKLPIEDLLEVKLLRVSDIRLCCLIISWGDVVHQVVDNLVDLIGVDAHKAWWNLAYLRILQVAQILVLGISWLLCI